MPDYEAGQARVSIVPDAREFLNKLKADLEAKNAPDYKVKVTADTGRATADMDRFRAEQERNPVNVRVKTDTTSASGELKKLFDLAFNMTKIGPIPIGVVSVGSLPAMATALTTVAAAIQQVSQAGLVLPGVFAGIGSSVAVAALGVHGMGDALKALNKASDGTAKSIQAADKALAGLSANQADAVRAIFGTKGALQDLEKLSGQNLFAGFSTNFKQLVASDLPTITRGVDGISKALGQNLSQTLKSLGSGQSQGILDRIFGNTANAQGRLTKAIDPIIHAMGTLAAAGSDTLPRLADGVGKLADRFDAFISKADGSGNLAKWINDGITGVDHLGSTLLNIGTTFTALTKAAGGGEGFLGTLDSGSKKLSEFLNSTAGQEKLKEFFTEGRAELDKWMPIIQNLAGILPGVFDAARDATNVWLPVLKDATDVLRENPDLIHLVTDAFIAWKSIDGITSLLGSLGKISGLLSDGLPGAAATGASGIGAALSKVAVPAWLLYLVGEHGGDIQKAIEDHVPGAKQLDELPNPGDWGKNARDWVNTHILGEKPPPAIIGPSPSDRANSPTGPTIPPLSPNFQSPSDRAVPGHASGGPTLSRRNGPTGGYIAELHPDEWVLPAHARKAIGDQALWAITKGRRFDQGGPGDLPWYPGLPIPKNPSISPLSPGNFNPGMKIDLSQVDAIEPGDSTVMDVLSGAYGDGLRTTADFRSRGLVGGIFGRAVRTGGVPGFDAGGHFDANGNPVTANTTGPIAPNPTAGGGGLIQNIFSGVAQGISGPLGNLAALGQAGMNVGGGPDIGHAASGGIGSGASGGANSLADRFASVPGLFGLLGSMGSSDPKKNLMGWGQQTGQWLGNFTAKTVGGFGSALWQGGLDFFGLGSSILSPNNSWNQSGQKLGDFAFGADGPLGKALGANKGDGSDSSTPTGSDRPGSSVSSSGGSWTSPSSVAAAGSGLVSGAKGGGGPSQWRSLVAQIVASRGLGPGWVDPLLRQIQTESGGNPASVNANDPNGRGGTQVVKGLFNFLPSTFASNGGQNIWNPADQINTAITYVLGKYGQTNGAPNYIGTPGRGFAAGGPVRLSGGGDPNDPHNWALPPARQDDQGNYLDAQGHPYNYVPPGVTIAPTPGDPTKISGGDEHEWKLPPNYPMPGVGPKGSDPGASQWRQFIGGPLNLWNLPGGGIGGFRPGTVMSASTGGPVWGAGTATSDSIPALLSNDEHVLTADDVAAMGGQSKVMQFRQALHRSVGGPIPMRDPRGSDPIGGADGGPSLGPFAPWWDMDWMPPEHPGRVSPSLPGVDGKWWHRGPTFEPGTAGASAGEPWRWPRLGKLRPPLPSDQRMPDWQIKGFAVGGGVGVPDALVPPPPMPPPMPTTTAHMMTPPAPPVSVAPQRPTAPQAPSIGGAASVAPQAPGQAFNGGGSSMNIAPAPSNLDHNLPAISQGITSAASVIGNLASQAIGAGMAGAGMPGGGAAGQFAAGLIKEGGKVVNDIVNVGSSFLVGSVPGSTGSQDRAFGQTIMPQQNVPVTAPTRGGTSMTFNGISDVDRLMQAVELRDAQSRAGLAHYGG